MIIIKDPMLIYFDRRPDKKKKNPKKPINHLVLIFKSKSRQLNSLPQVLIFKSKSRQLNSLPQLFFIKQMKRTT